MEEIPAWWFKERLKQPEAAANPIQSDHLEQIFSDEWDATFLNSLDESILRQVTSAANYLGIQSLVHFIDAKLVAFDRIKRRVSTNSCDNVLTN